jgi:spermidine/putrescine transport system permease protein
VLGRRGPLWGFTLPPAAWLAAFFVAPLALIVAYSLRAGSGFLRLTDPWQLSLEQYQRIVASPSWAYLLGVSVLMALAIALVATALAYPLAYFLQFRALSRAPLFLILLLLPFATSYLLRIMAWKLMLGPEGAVNSLLGWLGVISEPLDSLVYSRLAVIIALTYVWVPFAVLPIFAAMQRIERAQLEAAADLGAGPWARFWRVTLPLSLPGALAAFFMVFIPTVGEYVTPALVGGSSGSMYGNIIQQFFTRAGNWPLGAALSMIMLSLTVLLVLIALRVVNLRRMAT